MRPPLAQRPRPPALDKAAHCPGSGTQRATTKSEKIRWKCSIPIAASTAIRRGVVRLTICNAGSLNILSSAVTNGVREGFEKLAADRDIRAVILAGQSEKSMIGGADIKEMAKLDQKSAEAFITACAISARPCANFPRR